MGVQGGGSRNFDATNLLELAEIINELPAPPTNQPPKERWLLVSGFRSNQWFTSIYDRRDVPIEVERLFEVTRTPLEWSLSIVDSTTNFSCPSSTGKSLLQVAGKASTVVSLGLTGAQISDIQDGQESIITNISFGPLWLEGSLVMSAAVSTDGRFVAIGRSHEISMFDCVLKRIIWEKSAIVSSADQSHNDSVPRHLAITENNKVLIVNRSNGPLVEKWSLATGNRLSTLDSDSSGVETMVTSRDGRFLAVAFGNGIVRVWDTKTNRPPKSFANARWILSMAFSPNDRLLAISGYGDKRAITVWDLFDGKKVLARKNWNTSMPDDFDSISWSPDGNFFAGSPGGQGPVIFETKTWKPLACWGKHPISGGGQTRLAFLPDGSLLGQNNSGSLEVIDAATLKSLETHIQ
jgi:WD40 repeat protein